MGILKVFLMIIEVFSSILLIGIILLQKAKDEGLGLAFGAAMGETLFGSRAGNVLSKITIGLAVVFLVNTLLIGLLVSGSGGGVRSVTDNLPSTPSAPMQPAAQGQPASPMAPPPAGDVGVPATAPQSAPVAAPVSIPATAPAPAPTPATP